MALSRKYQKIFGKNAVSTDLSIVGSKMAGNIQYNTDIETIQSLSNWETGMRAIVSNSDAPYLQDHNSLFYVITTQLAYLFQAGIAEWNSQTEYINNRSLVLKSGKIYLAIADNTSVEPEVTSGWESSWVCLTDWLLKGVSFNSSFSTSISGYDKGTRILYTDEEGKKYYIESVKGSNTSSPSKSNIFYVGKIQEAVDIVPSISPNLPTASADNLGDIYLISAIVGSEKPSVGYVWVCVESGGSYTWSQKSVNSVFDLTDTIFVKNTGEYFAYWSQGTALNQIGYDNLASYKWIYIPTVPTESEFARYGITAYAIAHLQDGTKETIYHTTKPTLVICGLSSTHSNWAFTLQVSIDQTNWVTVGGYSVGSGDPASTSKINQIIDKDLYWKLTCTRSDYTLKYSTLY